MSACELCSYLLLTFSQDSSSIFIALQHLVKFKEHANCEYICSFIKYFTSLLQAKKGLENDTFVLQKHKYHKIYGTL